jgi:IS30 family transposase
LANGFLDLNLSFEERRKIAKWREGKMPVPEIADRLTRALDNLSGIEAEHVSGRRASAA